MGWLIKALTSPIGKKLLMALTGLFLCSFLLVHLIGNLQLLYDDGGKAFNTYAKFMTSNPFIKFISYGLYSTILLHTLVAIFITLQNNKARQQGYVYTDAGKNSKWNSRFMGVLGTLILAFIVFHMQDFWWEYHNGDLPMQTYTDENGLSYTVKDLYLEVKEAYENIIMVAIYVLAMIPVGYHLHHGFQSAFQTLGLNHNKYTPAVQTIGLIFSIGVSAGFAYIPLYIYFVLA